MRRAVGTRIGSIGATLVAAMLTWSAPPGVNAVDAATITPVQTQVDPAATAVLTNLTMVRGKAPGYITADKCSALQPGAQAKSNANFEANKTVANLAVVPIDPDLRFCLINQSPVDLIADVQGYLAPAAAGGLTYVAGDGARLLDTRIAPATRLTAGSITHVPAGGAIGASALLVNITMIGAVNSGYITAGACSSLAPGDQAFSNGNYGVGPPVSNLSVVQVDADGGFCIYAQKDIDLAVDVQGSFVTAQSDGLSFDLLNLPRALDTRTTGVRPAAGSITRVATGAPTGTRAVLANIAMLDAGASGYITADACSALHLGEQTRSNGNFGLDTTVSNLSVVPVDPDGSFCIYNQLPLDMTVDIQGAFSATGTQHFFPTPAARVLDTRPPTPPLPITSCTSVVHIGDSTSVGMISPAVISDPSLRIDAQYRRVGVLDPRMEISGARSIVETLPGQINAYDTARAIKASGYHGCWVFALGVTDTANIAAGSGPGRLIRIQKMMDLVAGDPVVWLTVKTYVADGPWSEAAMQLWNNALAQAVPMYPNLHVFDWAAVAQKGWYGGDRIHYTVDGYIQRAHLIADALADLLPG